ncbi:MAG: hypothetical protein AB1750_11505 [Chloroflexota bacterium]
MKDSFDDFDFDRPASARKEMPSLGTWDILSILVVVATLCIGAYFLMVFLNPNTPWNPLSPKAYEDTLPDTPTPTLIGLEPTWTPSATPYIPPTDTPRPTFTPIFTATLFSLVPPTVTPTFTATPKSPYSVKVEYIPSTKYHPEFGCNWQGVAGIVLDKNNAHVFGLQIILAGTWNGQTRNDFFLTGMLDQFRTLYGTSGFEFHLGDIPVASNKTLYLQLKDQGGGVQLSDTVYINTYTDCAKNMVFVTFKENR